MMKAILVGWGPMAKHLHWTDSSFCYAREGRKRRSMAPRRGPLQQGLQLFVFLERYHAQMRWIIKHHLSHQVPCYRPGLKLSSLLPNIPAKFAIVILRPVVFQQPALSYFNGSSCHLGTSGLNACGRQKPYQNCGNQTKHLMYIKKIQYKGKKRMIAYNLARIHHCGNSTLCSWGRSRWQFSNHGLLRLGNRS